MAEEAAPIDNENASDASSEPQTEEQGVLPSDHSDENEDAKIIVLQLSFNSTEETVREYFLAFGDIEKLDLKRYPDGSSRGFAFIIYKSEESLSNVLEAEEHIIDNRKVTVEKARTRSQKMQTNKIFIGKLPAELSEDNLRDYFATFGEIDEIQFVFNRQTNERKSFCFIQFKTTEAVEKITEGKIPPDSTRHTIESFEIECKKKFEDNHPIQRKIKAIERQKKGWDNYGGHSSHGGWTDYYTPPQYGGYGNYGYQQNYGPGYGRGNYGDSYGYNGYGYEEYNMYNGYYNNGSNNVNGGGGGGAPRGRGNKTNYN